MNRNDAGSKRILRTTAERPLPATYTAPASLEVTTVRDQIRHSSKHKQNIYKNAS